MISNAIIKRDQSLFLEKVFDLHRPIVYFITDGKPEGDDETEEAIQTAYNELTEDNDDRQFKAPAIYAIGIGNDIPKEVLEKYAADGIRLVRTTKQCREYDRSYKRANPDMSVLLRGDNYDLFKILFRNYLAFN